MDYDEFHVKGGPLEAGPDIFCSRELEERPRAEFEGPAHPVHVRGIMGGPHDSYGYAAIRVDGDWVIETGDLPNAAAEPTAPDDLGGEPI